MANTAAKRRRPFSLEHDMLPALTRALPKLLNADAEKGSVLMVREPLIGAIIPDVLVGAIHGTRPTILTKRITFVEASVLTLVEAHGRLSEEEVLGHLHLTTARARRAFDHLLQMGALTRERSGELRVRNAAKTSGVVLTALEVKLRRWREALGQAITYRRFADRSYVVLDGTQVRLSAQLLRAFRTAMVGLILQRGPDLHMVVRSPRLPLRSPERIRAIQKLLAV